MHNLDMNIPLNTHLLRYINLGQCFSGFHKFLISASKTATLYAKTTLDKCIHIIDRQTYVSGGGPIEIKLYESPTIVSAGTTAPDCISNLNLNSSITADITATINCTYSATGTLILKECALTGGVPKQSGSLKDGKTERILKKDTEYILTFENLGIADSEVYTSLIFYQCT